MSTLMVCLFAEFVCLALLVPGLTMLRRNVRSRLFVAVAIPVLATLPLMAAVRLELLSSYLSVTGATHLLLRAQTLAVAFSLALGGAAALLSRRWPFGGSAAVSVLAMLLLASPAWGDVLLRMNNKTVQSLATRWLVAPNPLFTIARLANYDWTHADTLYNMTRIAEDFVFAPSVPCWCRHFTFRGQPIFSRRNHSSHALFALLIAYVAVGLVPALLAGLLRRKGRPAEYLLSPGERL